VGAHDHVALADEHCRRWCPSCIVWPICNIHCTHTTSFNTNLVKGRIFCVWDR
jgi:hypothetical protein